MRDARRDAAASPAQVAPPSPAGDPIGWMLSPGGAAVREVALRAGAPVKLGVLVNGRADGGRMARAASGLTGPWPLRVTSELAGLRRALAELLAFDGVNVLALAGGDGTVHHACNALFALEAEAARLGCAAPAPRLLLLRGGTMNILARATGHQGAPARSLRRFAAAFAGAPLRSVPSRRLGTLLVRGGFGARHGFVFGSEVVYHALALYEGFGAGYGGLARFLGELVRGATFGSALWERERWRLGPFDLPLRICDGGGGLHDVDRYTAAVATTADLTLATGALAALRCDPLAEGFHCRVVSAGDGRELVKMLPALLAGGHHPGIRDVVDARQLALFGPCTLDGELIDDPAAIGRGTVEVSVGPRLQVVPAAIGSDAL